VACIAGWGGGWMVLPALGTAWGGWGLAHSSTLVRCAWPTARHPPAAHAPPLQVLLVTGVMEELDPFLDPLLEKRTVSRGRRLYVPLGDRSIELHPDFRAYFVSRLRNPTFSAETQARTTVRVGFLLATACVCMHVWAGGRAWCTRGVVCVRACACACVTHGPHAPTFTRAVGSFFCADAPPPCVGLPAAAVGLLQVVDFTVTMLGLEEQLLGRVIAKEQKALEDLLTSVVEELNVNRKVRRPRSPYRGWAEAGKCGGGALIPRCPVLEEPCPRRLHACVLPTPGTSRFPSSLDASIAIHSHSRACVRCGVGGWVMLDGGGGLTKRVTKDGPACAAA
jgi:hypothetical protein